MAGGSIFGSAFDVRIYRGRVHYRETVMGGTKEVRAFEREVTSEERDHLNELVARHHLLQLSSQDFSRHPLRPDQATYQLFVGHEGQAHRVSCSIPLPDEPAQDPCQAPLDDFRKDLNGLLGLAIN